MLDTYFFTYYIDLPEISIFDEKLNEDVHSDIGIVIFSVNYFISKKTKIHKYGLDPHLYSIESRVQVSR